MQLEALLGALSLVGVDLCVPWLGSALLGQEQLLSALSQVLLGGNVWFQLLEMPGGGYQRILECSGVEGTLKLIWFHSPFTSPGCSKPQMQQKVLLFSLPASRFLLCAPCQRAHYGGWCVPSTAPP